MYDHGCEEQQNVPKRNKGEAMKRAILVLAVLLCSAFPILGNAFVGIQARGILGNADYVSAVAGTPDTIGPADSIVLYVGEERVNRQLIVGWDTLTGTGNDSVDFKIEMEALGPAGEILKRATDTTVTWNTPSQYVLPLGTVLVGSTYRCVIRQGAGAGGELIFKHIRLHERKAKY
jgi:hypothetical protein